MTVNPGQDNAYLTIASEVATESKVKASRFIARAAPIAGRQGAETYVKGIADKFREATHNCFAYKIGVGDEAESRAFDDGEPSGTAGKPILQAIESKGLTQIVLVVTRYFGGTKLGVGGLIRAYGAAAKSVLDQAQIVEHIPVIELILEFDYELAHSVHVLLDKFNGSCQDSRFDEKTQYRVHLPAKNRKAFERELRDMTSGRVLIIHANN